VPAATFEMLNEPSSFDKPAAIKDESLNRSILMLAFFKGCFAVLSAIFPLTVMPFVFVCANTTKQSVEKNSDNEKNLGGIKIHLLFTFSLATGSFGEVKLHGTERDIIEMKQKNMSVKTEKT